MKEEWKDKLRDGLADYEETIPAELWSDIERAMAESRTDMVKPMGGAVRKSAAAKVIAWRIVAAAAACVACGVGVFLYVSGNEHGDDAVIADRVGAAPNGKPMLASALTAAQPSSAGAEKSRKAHSGASAFEAEPSADASLASASGNSAPEPSPAEDSQAAAGQGEKPMAAAASEKQYKSSVAASASRYASSAASSAAIKASSSAFVYSGGKISASLYAANMTAGAGSGDDSRMVLASDVSYSMMPNPDGEMLMQTIKGYVSSGFADEKTTKHRQPLRLGLSVRYAINSRWGVQSGLTYSYLRSDMATRSAQLRYDTKQKVHFVGIPLAVDYSLWSSRWLSAYVMAGGMVEKSVKAEASTTYSIGNAVISEESQRLKIRQLQWSANAAAGIQLNVTSDIGIYAEPGVGYCFDSGSSVKTAYTDKPLNFSIKVGLRYNFEK